MSVCEFVSLEGSKFFPENGPTNITRDIERMLNNI